MSLAAGTKLGPYEITGTIGAGGMGEVYRAVDTRLGREVALKVLPESVAGDSARCSRFKAEAQAVAALNHPNIVALYDIGDGFLITELVDGEPLRADGRSVRKIVELATQVASGLGAAHAAGIVHRDLKPDNILVTREGRAKILDFGLAKPSSVASAASASGPTLTVHTDPGTVVGTPGYMSPEQVRGTGVDHRSDIFSFGLILYELLAGKRAFEGSTSAELMTAILRQDAPELPESVPVALRHMVTRCLEKEPRARFQSAQDLAFALTESVSLSGTAAPAVLTTPRLGSRRNLLLAATGSAAALAGAGWIGYHAAPRPVKWTSTGLGGPEVAWRPRLSPDGKTIVLMTLSDGQSQLALMRPETGDWTLLTHPSTEGAALAPSWSRDGNMIYFQRTNVASTVRSIPIIGGAERTVLDRATYPEPLPDGTILAARFNDQGAWRLCRLWPDSSRLLAFDIEVLNNMQVPFRAFPSGKRAAVLGRRLGQKEGTSLFLVDLESGAIQERRKFSQFTTGAVAISRDESTIFYSGPESGIRAIRTSGNDEPEIVVPLTRAVFGMDTASDGSLIADQGERPIELLRLKGTAVTAIAQGQFPGWKSYFAVLPDGRAVWPQVGLGKTRLVGLREGQEPTPVVSTTDQTSNPTAAVGSDRLAFVIGDEGSAIGIASLADGRVLTRLNVHRYPIGALGASPEGETIYFQADRSVWSLAAAGGEPKRLCEGDTFSADPNGKFLAVVMKKPTRVRLFRYWLPAGPLEEVRTNGEFQLTGYIGPGALDRQGRLLMGIEDAKRSWFYRPAVVDLSTGNVSLLPVHYDADFYAFNWAPDGSVLAIAGLMRSSLWRFTPGAK